MSPIPTGLYTITRPGDQVATLEGGHAAPGTPIVVLPHGKPSEAQKWHVHAVNDGNVTIRNYMAGTYMSYEDEAEENKPVRGYPESREWSLYPVGKQGTFHVVVPGGGDELAFDMLLYPVFPPQTALRRLHVEDEKQAWHFQLAPPQ